MPILLFSVLMSDVFTVVCVLRFTLTPFLLFVYTTVKVVLVRLIECEYFTYEVVESQYICEFHEALYVGVYRGIRRRDPREDHV